MPQKNAQYMSTYRKNHPEYLLKERVSYMLRYEHEHPDMIIDPDKLNNAGGGTRYADQAERRYYKYRRYVTTHKALNPEQVEEYTQHYTAMLMQKGGVC